MTTPPLALTALQNVRDLGGLPVAGGGEVRHGVLYRSDAPYPGDEVPALAAWPPRTVIDLRSEEELAGAHPLSSDATTVIPLPLFERANPVALMRDDPADLLDLSDVYAAMLRASAPALVRVLAAVAEGPSPVLVHCVAGKDRTGVVIAVLLNVLGVSRDAIIADYRVTEGNMPGVVGRVSGAVDHPAVQDAMERIARERPELLTTPEAAMAGVLDELARHPLGVAGWLGERGLAAEAIAALREHLTVPAGA